MSNDISKKIRNIRAKEGMSIEEFATFLEVDVEKVQAAEDNGVVEFEIINRMNEVCPEHLFFLLIDSFENEDKGHQANAAFKKKWASKNGFKLDLRAGEDSILFEFKKYLNQIEKDYEKSFGFKLLKIMKAEKLTYEKLNQLTDTSESTLKKYSGNHVTPGLDFVQLLCSIYPYYTIYLMFDEMPERAGPDQITPEEKTLRDLSTSEETV